ncbi:hypothetical protein [Massilia litorea]|uniref:Glycosyltransferase n=1 Tax=Massilia litorea TaxID=2769491 RepID=A0A7L9U7G5_9BURK|nr:hypothetical protein [Massilia litorea]QOL50928.1 hypothetical protein LPB04_06485 [Massilia litorea]
MIVEPRSIAIIASREDVSTLAACIRSAIQACKDRRAVVDVLVNGNPELAHNIAGLCVDVPPTCVLRVWRIQQGDKAHAWNEYVHRIWASDGDAIFLDGYVEVEPDSFDALDRGLATAPEAQGATGVPTCGRSALHLRALMLSEGGFHGNLNLIRAGVMAKLRASGFRLPLGLYRTDSVTGAVLMLGLDPAANHWDRRRIAVVPDAIWNVRSMERITFKNILGQWKRMLRQAQGVLENRAVREHLIVRGLAPHLLPSTAHGLVNGWITAQPAQARRLFIKQPLCAWVAWRLRVPRDWSAADIAPVVVPAPVKRHSIV